MSNTEVDCTDSESLERTAEDEEWWRWHIRTLGEGRAEIERALRESRASLRLRRTYGIWLGDYRRLYDEQGGCCAGCGDFHERLHVDHCHRTGRVRGLLCRVCNLALGRLRDDASAAGEIGRRYGALETYLYEHAGRDFEAKASQVPSVVRGGVGP
jgi:hypothetical protein